MEALFLENDTNGVLSDRVSYTLMIPFPEPVATRLCDGEYVMACNGAPTGCEWNTDSFVPRSNAWNVPFERAQKMTLSWVSTSRGFGESGGAVVFDSPSGGEMKNAPSPRSPRLVASTGFRPAVPRARSCVPEETSHRRTVPSFAPETIVRPRETIPIEVTARVWPMNVRTGEIRTGSLVGGVDCALGSAGSMERVKSPPEVRSTREEGKKRTDVTVLRWHFLARLGGERDDKAEMIYTEPSSYPVANCEPSGATSKAEILRY